MHQLIRSSFVAVFLFAATLARADDDAAAEAKKQFRAGVNLLDDPDGAKYEEAFHAFKKAYALSQNPRVLGNVGFCAMHLERDGEAIDAYAAYLRDASDIDEREREQIQRDLATLTSTVAKIRVVVRHPATAFTLVDTRAQTRGPAVENSYEIQGKEISLRVRPGRHTFRVRAADAESLSVDASLEPASDTTHELTFPPPRVTTPLVVRETSPSLAGPIALGAAGVVVLGAGVTAGLLARSKQGSIEDRCPNDLCPATYDLESERTTAKTYGTVADAAFVGGGVLVAGAALWYVLQPKRRTTRPSTTASAMCTPAGCGFVVGRGF
ncbi:MAG: hypothetical protein KIT84_04995 [Labilithrix sp.]|nr:hypothetical protein [Labilithrix sp.]MCW5810344.1 hypothetical protein [Labilithrix sp.]